MEGFVIVVVAGVVVGISGDGDDGHGGDGGVGSGVSIGDMVWNEGFGTY